jgi:hypothetical protein
MGPEDIKIRNPPNFIHMIYNTIKGDVYENTAG